MSSSRPKKKLPLEQKDSKKSYVLQPRQTDVLCGRGGMSNHHAGNEWYRRLIKSNRPLYRACPKHTKLLVAKAVVQAVEQQNGRFLDKEKSTGLWYVVEYKRAVDKTSQGLREKDRNGDGSEDEEDIEEMINPPTDLNALARQISQADPAPTEYGIRYEYPGTQHSKKSPPHAAKESDDYDPLPPHMQPRQTSMFRFLQSTKLLEDRKPPAETGRGKRSENGDAPSLTRFQSQVSDWLTSFWPVGEDGNPPKTSTHHPPTKKRKAPPVATTPPTELETGASQVLLQMATSSKLFRGFSTLFEDPSPAAATTADSLLDDYEESPVEKRMRNIE